MAATSSSNAASAQRVSISSPDSASSSIALTPTLRSQLNNALLANNAIPAMQAALLHECQASGFVTALRARVLELLRSGDASSYGDVMRVVMAELKDNGRADGKGPFSGGGTEGGAVVVKNGTGSAKERKKEAEEKEKEKENQRNGDAGQRTQLAVPKRVVEEGIRVVRQALEGCVDIAVEGEGR